MVTEIIQNDAHNDDTDKMDIQTVQKKMEFVVHTIKTIYGCKLVTMHVGALEERKERKEGERRRKHCSNACAFTACSGRRRR